MKKETTIILIILLTTNIATAIEWHEQRRIAKKILYKENYKGQIRFMYYIEQEYWAYYEKNNKIEMITFYKGAEQTNKQTFKCLVLHELGHSKQPNKQKKLNETYADNYMQQKDKTCERWYQ